MKSIIIIGNGIAGITAARYIRKLDSEAKITVISSETEHFFSRTALMYIYMGQMKFEDTKPYPDDFWAKNRIELLQADVTELTFENNQLVIGTKVQRYKGTEIEENNPYIIYHTSHIIIAAGSKPNRLNIKGENTKGVQGLYSYQDLCLMEENTKNIQQAVVVGGGLIGIEMVEMLLSRKIKVSFLVRENSFWNNVLPAEESAMLNRHILEHGVDLQLSSELKEIIADDNGRVQVVELKNGEKIACQFVGVAVGVSPNIDFLKNTALEAERGILVDEFLQTNIPNVYAIGDCVQHRKPPKDRRNIEQIWYSGREMGETVAKTICEKPNQYEPQIFFNSAKFFDIEYQTYGIVPAKIPEGISSFYWEHSSGKKCVRINYETDTKIVRGVNTFGIRMRQAVWQDWLSSKKTIDFVLKNLEKANFDPEFFKRYEKEIISCAMSDIKHRTSNTEHLLK